MPKACELTSRWRLPRELSGREYAAARRCNRTLRLVSGAFVVMAIPLREQPSYEELSDHIGTWGRMENTRNQTRRYLMGFSRSLPEAHILPAVNGFNYTETIDALMRSGLPFRNLSRSGLKWGVLATFLTHHRALVHQVRHRLPFQITLEEDLHLRRTPFLQLAETACATAARSPEADLLQLSPYGEVRLTSLRGATHILQVLKEWGILRNIDQQLFDPAVMGRCHRVLKLTQHMRAARSERPFILGRQ